MWLLHIMRNTKITKGDNEKPIRLCGTPEQNERFAWNKELFSLFKKDLSFWSEKITRLLESFEIEGEVIDDERDCVENHDWISKQIRENTQPIRDICNDLLGNYIAEIPHIISSPKYGGVKEAERRWFKIQKLYKQIKRIEDKQGILHIFREIKGKKHGTWWYEAHILQEGENRLSLLKSDLKLIEKKNLQ